MSSEPNNEPVNNLDEVEKPQPPQKYQYTLFILSLSVMIITMITLVTGQWLKPDGQNKDTRQQYDLWGQCECQALDLAWNCAATKRLARAAAGFSLIGVVLQFISIIALSTAFFNISNTAAARGIGIASAWLVVVALVLTWTIWGGLFRVRRCDVRLDDITDLDWAFGIRVGESVLWVAAAALLSIGNSRDVNFKRVALFLAVTVFIATIATSTGRGWATSTIPNSKQEIQLSLFEACTCTRSNDFECKDQRRFFRSVQGMATLGVFLQFLLVVFVIFAMPAALHTVFAFVVGVCIIVTFSVYAWWFNRDMCGKPSVNEKFALYWPFGLNVIAFILEVITFVVALVGACGHFN